MGLNAVTSHSPSAVVAARLTTMVITTATIIRGDFNASSQDERNHGNSCDCIRHQALGKRRKFLVLNGRDSGQPHTGAIMSRKIEIGASLPDGLRCLRTGL